MAQKLNQRTLDFVSINHYFMTMSEMAAEINVVPSNIKIYCDHLGVTAVTVKERAHEFMLKNKNLTAEELAEKMDMNIKTIRDYAKELGIDLLTNIKKEKAIKIEKGARYMKPENYPTEVKKQIYQATGVTIKIPKPLKRAPAIYTQSGSDITDKWYGKTTTKRVKVNASDAFFK